MLERFLNTLPGWFLAAAPLLNGGPAKDPQQLDLFRKGVLITLLQLGLLHFPFSVPSGAVVSDSKPVAVKSNRLWIS